MISQNTHAVFDEVNGARSVNAAVHYLCGFFSESALSESNSKSACAFPTTSSAALVLASSAQSFSFSFRSRSLSTSARCAQAARPAYPTARDTVRVLLYCLTPLLDMGVYRPSRRSSAPARVRR